MAAAQAADAEGSSGNGAVALHGFERVLGAGRGESASEAERPEEAGQNRRERCAVNPQRENQNMLSKIHSKRTRYAASFNSLPCRRAVK